MSGSWSPQPPEEPAASLTTEQRCEHLVIFLGHVGDEVHDRSWSPTSAQVGDLHERLAREYHDWLRTVGRHP